MYSEIDRSNIKYSNTLKTKRIIRINMRKTGIPNAPKPRPNETIIPIAVYDEGIA